MNFSRCTNITGMAATVQEGTARKPVRVNAEHGQETLP
jgi:hypothetical protein